MILFYSSYFQFLFPDTFIMIYVVCNIIMYIYIIFQWYTDYYYRTNWSQYFYLAPFMRAKLLNTDFYGINNIKPKRLKKFKVTFDSNFHANICLDSHLLNEHKLLVYTSSTLIFLHWVIKLDRFNSLLCKIVEHIFKID
jgi:hypothetical protein